MLFRRKKKEIKAEKKDLPDGLWLKCKNCGEILYKTQLEKNLWVCPKCGFHMRITSRDYMAILLDDGKFDEEIAPDLCSGDPLGFPDYKDKLENYRKRTGLKDAAVAGIGCIDGKRVVLFLTDFNFMGGSMGSAVGEKFYRAAQKAIELRIPLVALTASGGGARMHEGIISLMQMVKTSLACAELDEARIPYINVLTDPTMAGVMASFASLGDVIIAEPGALLGFTGPRVIKQTIGEELPPGFQRSEFLLEHGMVDGVVPRKALKTTISKILDVLRVPENG